MPGHINKLAVDTDTPGYYFGQCAEFCGDSHALMRFKVIVEPEEQFLAWQEAWRAGPTQASADSAPTATCPPVPADVRSVSGLSRDQGTKPRSPRPELGCRKRFTEDGRWEPQELLVQTSRSWAAERRSPSGTLTNTPENLADWLHDPGAIKPGNYMGDRD